MLLNTGSERGILMADSNRADRESHALKRVCGDKAKTFLVCSLSTLSCPGHTDEDLEMIKGRNK